MKRQSIKVLGVERWAKLFVGPNSAKAGPLLDRVVITDTMHPVKESSGSKMRIARDPRMRKKKAKVKITKS